MKNKIIVETKYGILHGIFSVEIYSDGRIKECSTEERVELETPFGKLVPHYQNEGVRSRYMKSLEFHNNGILKKIALEEQTTVKTRIGSVKAELIQFYESGAIKRVFPLNGKITGYWTEENEYELAENIKFEFPFGSFEKKPINILFYESGKVKSITFWQKELLTVPTPTGKMGVRYGLGMYESGKIKSLEPAYPVMADTPIGKITAFDVNANGINGDVNSLNFKEDGSVKSLLTSMDVIVLTKTNGEELIFEPGLRPSLLHENGMDILPLKIQFEDGKISFPDKTEEVYPIRDYKITVKNNSFQPVNQCGSCEGCSGCM